MLRLLRPTALAAFGTVLTGALLLAGCQRTTSAAAPAAPPPPPEVAVVALEPQRVALTRELPGRISASVVAEVRPQVNGLVKQRLFTEGSAVKAGQALYQIDDASYRAEHASAQAALARAEAALKAARLTAARMAELARVNAVSQQDNENATAALHVAEADVKAAKAALHATSVVLDRARITAPITGRIGKSSVTQGALVTANQAAALATVQQLDPVYVDLTQSSAELLRLRKELAAGTLTQSRDVPVTILLEDSSRYTHQGKLAFTDVSVDPATGSFLLRVRVPNPDGILLPGMYVRAEIGNGERADALLVPQEAIARDPKGNTSAMVVDAQGQVQARAVQVSRTVGDRWLVDGGLVAGDRVIVAGLQKVRPGAPVRVVDATSTPASADAAASAAPRATQP